MPRPPARTVGEKTTRDQILDVAMELFNTAGYEKTSLREIAERMGFSKAALYYHFASKDDILLALHLRLHDLGREGFGDLDAELAHPQEWPGLLDRLIDKMLDNRALIVLHVRNRAALVNLHGKDDDPEHEDLEQRFQRILTDPTVQLSQRVRLACAFGAIMSGLILAGDVFSDVATAELSSLLRGAVRDLVDPARTAPTTPTKPTTPSAAAPSRVRPSGSSEKRRHVG